MLNSGVIQIPRYLSQNPHDVATQLHLKVRTFCDAMKELDQSAVFFLQRDNSIEALDQIPVWVSISRQTAMLARETHFLLRSRLRSPYSQIASSLMHFEHRSPPEHFVRINRQRSQACDTRPLGVLAFLVGACVGGVDRRFPLL